MRAIFISYRRDDSEGQAGRLFKDLSERLGEDAVFMDVVDIEPGRDFRRAIDQQVASCGVLLAVIGKGWLDAKDESGRRRLDDPADFVRLETATALRRDIPVVPVLVQGARMPKAEDLPAELADLAYRNAVELTHARWDSDVQLLIKALRLHVAGGAEQPESAPGALRTQATAGAGATGALRPTADVVATPAATSTTRKPLIAAVVAAAALIAIGGYIVYDRAERATIEAAEEQRVAREKAEADQLARDKALLDAQAAKLAEERAAAQAETARLEREKASLELQRAKAAAEQAAAEKAAAQAEASKATAEAAAAKAEAGRAAAERAAEKAAERAAAEAQRRSAQSRAAESTTPAARAPAKVARYEGTIYTTNPCTGQALTAKGTMNLSIQTLPDRVIVSEHFTGSGGGFEVVLSGAGEFARPARSYDVAIRAQWRSRSGVQFTSVGVDRVTADEAGTPNGDLIQRLDNRCQ